MSGQRFVGLSKKQPVPRLLSVIRRDPASNNMKDVDVDAPPLSSSDQSDDDGLPVRGDIQPSRFLRGGRQQPSPRQQTKATDSGKSHTDLATSRKRTRASTGPLPDRQLGSSTQELGRRSDSATAPNESSPATKQSKSNTPSDGELGSQFDIDPIFHTRKRPIVRRYGGTKALSSGVKEKALPTKRFKRPPKAESPEPPSPERRKKFEIPSSPSMAGEDPASPARKLNLPDDDLDSPADVSPVRKKQFTMPDDDTSTLLRDLDGPEGSQRLAFSIPEELPEPFVRTSEGNGSLTVSPPAGASSPMSPLRNTTSPLTDLGSLDSTPVCPLCRKVVDQAHLDDFKERHPRLTVANMRKFCQDHKRRSARETWIQKGYPDIDWRRLDERISRHYGFLRKILEDGMDSHYVDVFQDTVRAGKNRTLFRSDANLTPGYYGIRGLRAMSENLIQEFSSILRKRALQDRLVSARGYTVYLQSVLVPELAVRLIMEDMSVGEEEARRILEESSDVGELLNDEIADVVLEDDDVVDPLSSGR